MHTIFKTFTLTILLFSSSCNAMSYTKANICAAIGSIGTTLLVASIFNRSNTTIKTDRIASAVTLGLSGAFFYALFHSYTPQGLVSEAKSIMKSIDMKLLTSTEAYSKEQITITQLVNTHFASDKLSLISAFKVLVTTKKQLTEVLELTQTIRSSKSSRWQDIAAANKIVAQIKPVWIDDLNKALIAIKSEPNYMKELNIKALNKLARATRRAGLASSSAPVYTQNTLLYA